MEDFEDIALPLTAEQYKHNVENVHMCLGQHDYDF